MLVFQPDLFEKSGFPIQFPLGAADLHADFGGSVPPENWPIVDDRRPCAIARSRYGGAHSSHAASDNADVKFVGCLIEVIHS